MNLYAARHAAVSVRGVCYGQSDVPTAVTHERAADALLEEIARRELPLERVVCSPWERAQRPAERIAERLGVPLAVDLRLSELAFGEWEGKPYDELEKHDPRFRTWMGAFQTERAPGGERLDDLLVRVRAAYVEMLSAGAHVLVVAHAGSIRALRAIAHNRPFSFDPVPHLEIEKIV